MRNLYFALAGTVMLAGMLVLLAPEGATAQSGVAAVEKVAAALAPKGWILPRTADGHPDLQGYYTNVSLTPMSRPKELGEKQFFTPEEATAYIKKPTAQHHARFYNDGFFDAGTDIAVTMQTSLVVDPPDGRVPAYTPAVQKEIAKERQEVKEKCADPTRVCPPGQDEQTPTLADKPSDFPLMTRCIKWGTSGPPMLPSIYDSNYHIVQTPNYVMIQVEGGRDVRIIPLDGRPHLDPSIRLWLGDSRGHWEGTTLVVDTTNFSDDTNFQHAGKNLHVTERFTRVAPNVILYEFTVTDPTTWTSPWTGIIPMTAIKGPIYEYACHEGNYAMGDILRGARLEEKQRTAKLSGESKPTPVSDAGQQ